MKRLSCLCLTMCLLLAGCIQHTTPAQTTSGTAAFATTTHSVTATVPSTTTTAATTTSVPLTIPTVGGSLNVATTPPADTDDFSLTEDQLSSLEVLIASYDGTVSVGYYDILSGYQYTYNGTQSFPAASVIKAPFCRYIFGMAEQESLDLTTAMTYTEEMLVGGTGIIKDAEFGTNYTQEELIKLTIRKSDNVAFKMLRQIYPANGFKQYAKAIGITDVAGIKNISSSNINAVNAITYMKDIYAYITGENLYGSVLEAHMRNTVNPMISSRYPIVRKYGWMTGAYHDMAIIKAPRPYILVILSDHDGGTKEDNAMFRDISKAIEAMSGNA